MKNTGIRAIAQHLQKQGRGKDTILAHIMPEEAALLKARGGSGTINPKTGLLEFLAESDASYGGGGYGYGQSSYGSGGGGDTSGGWSTSYSGGGGGRDSSSSMQSPSYTSVNDGFNSANWGTGTGMLTTATPSMTTSGGNGGWAPSSGNSTSNYLQSIGVPSIVANAAQTVGNSLLNFSDWSTAAIKDVYNNPSYYAGQALNAITPSVPETPATSIEPWTGKTQVNIPQSAGTFRTDMIGTPTILAESGPTYVTRADAGYVPEAPTSASNMYNFTPNYSGTAQEGADLYNQSVSNMAQQQINDAFGTTQERAFPEVPNAADYYGVSPSGVLAPTPQPIDTQVDMKTVQPSYNVDPYGFSGMQTQVMPGTQYGPVSSFGVTPGQTSPNESAVSTDRLISAVKTWAPWSTSGMSDAEIKQGIISGLPEGMTFNPETNTIVNNTGLSTDDAISTLANSTVQWFNREVPVSQFLSPTSTPSASNYGAVTGPTFTSEAPATQFAQNLGDSLEMSLKEITQPSVSMAFPETGTSMTYPGQPQAPANLIDYSTERMTDPRMQPQNLREAISNPSLYYGMGYPSLVNMPNPTAAGVSAMLANIQRESSFNPAAYNPGEFGFGFAQYQRSRLPGFLNAMGIDMGSLPADKTARAQAIKTALANTDAQQIGYMLNEIATAKQYAPTYRALTESTSPGAAATTYMRNFEGAQMAPERVAAQAANAERIARTQFAGTQLSPTTARTIQDAGITSSATTQAAIQNGDLGAVLDTGFEDVLAALYPDLPAENAVAVSDNLFGTSTPSGGGGGGGSYAPTSTAAGQGFAVPTSTPVAETPTPVYTTGMNLARRRYTPSLSTETYSPAYS